MTKERIQWLDNLKGLLIITVVLGHCIQHTFFDGGENVVFRYIYSFHMMLFMFVSGYACYRPNVEWKLVGRRAKQLLIPFLVWSLVLCAIRGEFQLFDMILKPEKSFWFLWALFFITLFHVLACRMAERLRWKDELTSLVFGVLLLGFAAVTHINYFAIQLVAFHFVFYTLGFYCHKYDVIKKIPIWAIISSFICWFVMAWFWAGSKPIHQLEYQNTVLTIAFHFITALVAIIAFVPAVQCWLNRKSLILNEIGGGYAGNLCRSSFAPFAFAR